MGLGKEWIGRLPPGADEQLAATLKSWRGTGLVTGVEVLGCDDCEASLSMDGVIFPIAKPPELPFAGCKRAPCCGCCYSAVLDIEGGSDAKLVDDGRSGTSGGRRH